MTQSQSVIRDAALFATLYGKQGQLVELVEAFRVSFHLKEDSRKSAYIDKFTNRNEKIYLFHFNLPIVEDTSIIQLIFGDPTKKMPVIKAWEKFKNKFDSVENLDVLLNPLWGYTLVYQADLISGAKFSESLPDEVTDMFPFEALATSSVIGGKLWLINIPIRTSKSDMETVYVALASPKSKLVTNFLVGVGADILIPDLISHKGHHQRYEYGYELKEGLNKYAEYIKNMHDESNNLLLKFKAKDFQPELSSHVNNLEEKYSKITMLVSEFQRFHISFQQQLNNYDLTKHLFGTEDKEEKIIKFHRRHILAGLQETKNLVYKGQNALETAKIAVESITRVMNFEQAETAKKEVATQERRQRQLDITLALVGIVLGMAIGIPEWIDDEFFADFVYQLDYWTGIGMGNWLGVSEYSNAPWQNYNDLILFCFRSFWFFIVLMFIRYLDPNVALKRLRWIVGNVEEKSVLEEKSNIDASIVNELQETIEQT